MRRLPAAWRILLLLAGALGVLVSIGLVSPVQAQRSSGQFGLGGQAGRPSGFTAKLYRNAQLGYDMTLGWDLENYFFAHVHRMHERPLPNSPLHAFAGPGLFAGFDDALAKNRTIFGISGNFGLNFFREQFEVFLQITPRLRLYPNTRGRLGGSVGLRYFF